ncbi:MAG: acyl carrier protein, partial [Stackebrandtia sp.]
MTDSAAVDRVCDGVRNVAARQIGCDVGEVTADATFFDLGADSLLLVGMVRELERTFGVKVAMRELFSAGDTPRRLAELISSRLDPTVLAAPPAAAAPTTEPPQPSQVAPTAPPTPIDANGNTAAAPPQAPQPAPAQPIPAMPPVAPPIAPIPAGVNPNIAAAQVQL